MVTEKDLQEDYKEILASGELDKPIKEGLHPFVKLGVWLIVLFLSLWTVAWLYTWF